LLIGSAAMVVTARNPVHSVLFLILAFFNAAALFLLAGAEFLAMILVIVYVGAVAVLFLFVVMMLDINFAQMREGFQRYAPIGATVGAMLLLELGIVLAGWKFAPDSADFRFAPRVADVANTAQIGQILYTDYILLFQLSGLVLLVAMIGAIVLTLRDRGQTRRQNIDRQLQRKASETMVMVDAVIDAGVPSGDYLHPRPEPEVAAPDSAPAGHGGH
jgi:NADH-quinone oxidoreductase subunit J